MTRVCVVGSVNLDAVFTVAALPAPGETVLGSTPATVPGGKGGNQAVAAARAGAQVCFVGAVGDDDAGALLRRHLADNGVGTAGLVTVPGPSGAAIITVDTAGQNTIVVVPGANSAVEVNAGRDAIAGAQVLLLQLEIPIATAAAAARIARAAGATVIVNVSPAGGEETELARLVDLVDVAVVNETESARFDHPVPHRVVTLGANGARYTGADGTVHVPAPVVDAVDTSGAGDVFAGVLAAEWPRGIAHALRCACAAGALATQVRGAGDCAPDSAAITRMLRDHT
ncbi:ribokinase [[Mycobacterium] vasticus]|uniref:Ribokinase n=1 Tax=[Mycobacterium] vasticus TaxID=2875777 RepID=A0ABU5YRC0_9MYCO|nr:ribokinase [Mycolicibacter sp. MYC017]MEB3067662.1 ribokinase [Mycolicibacter sp. MYC017]